MTKPRTIEEFEARQTEIRSRLAEINTEYEAEAFPEEVRSEWNALDEEFDANTALIEELRFRQDRLVARSQDPKAREGGAHFNAPRKPADIYDLVEIRRQSPTQQDEQRTLREYAKRSIDQATFPHESARREDTQEHVERLLDKFEDADERAGASDVHFARRILATGSPLYKRAFAKVAGGRAPGSLSSEEQRALSTAGSGGGYAVPYTLDPTIIPTSNGAVNPLRQISRVESITTTTWRGVTSAGITVGYDTEAAEVGDDSPTLGQPEVTPVRADGFVPFSVEIGQDWGGLQESIAVQLQDAKDELEASKFISGTGTNEPQGLTVGATTVVTAAGTGVFAVADIYATHEALPDRFEARARWIAHKAVYNDVRQFDTGGGADLWVRLADGNPAELIGYPAHNSSGMQTAYSAGKRIAVFGDYRYFLIVDRVGMDIELVPHLFHTSNNRPSGQRGFLAIWRNTSEVLSASAFRVLIGK